MSYGTAPISSLQRAPISRRWRGLAPGHLLFALLFLTGAGGGGAVAEDLPLPRPRPSVWLEPHTFREAAGPDFNSTEVTNTPTDCNQRLQAIAVIELLPRLIGPDACGGGDIVRLHAVMPAGNGSRIEFKPAPILRCAFAESVAGWLRDEAAPQADKLGAPLRAVETYDAFECRGRNRVAGGKLSEHGKANAVDLRSFTLADGRTVGLTDVKAAKEFRDEIRDSACRRFTTVLGPGSDSYHESHIHLDLIERRKGFRMCQWEVRTPKPEITAQAGAQGTP
ncbi:MAG TPA: extensin family protein, partial [Pseudolabrys sp.]|nr:extensin family protein [Pseudolabrys sp.]